MELSVAQIQETLFQTILDHSLDAIVFVDENATIKVWNQGAAKMFGVAPEEAVGKNFHDLVFDPELIELERQRFADADELRDAQSGSLETRVKIAGSRELWVDQALHRFDLMGQKWGYIELRDADSRKRRETELERAATTDELSQLENRRGFQQLLEANLHHKLTLGIIDIDNFKQINDRFGHEKGDDAIRFVAKVLKDFSTDIACVARLGGDEFGVVLRTANREAIEQYFDSFRETIATSGFLDDADGIQISIGVACSDRPNVASRDLLSTADRALYQSKNEGRNRVTVFTVE